MSHLDGTGFLSLSLETPDESLSGASVLKVTEFGTVHLCQYRCIRDNLIATVQLNNPDDLLTAQADMVAAMWPLRFIDMQIDAFGRPWLSLSIPMATGIMGASTHGPALVGN